LLHIDFHNISTLKIETYGFEINKKNCNVENCNNLQNCSKAPKRCGEKGKRFKAVFSKFLISRKAHFSSDGIEQVTAIP